jgi:zinc D-Ala-D-Ala dipeptidase
MRRAGVAAVLGGMLALAPAAPAGAQQKAPAGFVSLKAEVPSIKVEMRYLTSHNFIGRPIKGYRDPLCIVTRETAEALSEAQESVRRQGYTLKVYDCYRPQRAVDDFVAWGKRLRDQRMKAEFYPRVDKRDVFKDGYIAAKSGHSRGSTVDLTLVRRPPARQERYHRGDRLRDCAARRAKRFRDNSIDMGTGYDCFDPLSHPFNARVTGKQRANRMKLRRAMLAAGFKGLETEWWHFTLRDERFPERYFDFPVSRAALAG